MAAALTGGVPHPTGYPTHQLLLRVATSLYGGSEPARAGAWLSALCAAAAVALLTDLARRTLGAGEGRSARASAVAALVAGMAWAVSPLLWGQAVIVEVYALNALFCVALLWLLWRWGEARDAGGGGERWLALAGLTFGVGLGNHVTLALMLPAAAYWLWAKGRGRADVRRGLILAALTALSGLLIYAYLPLMAAKRPPVNWGDPVTLDRFVWVVTGRLYARLAFGLPLAELPARLAGWASVVVRQFMPWGLAFAIIGLWQLDRRHHHWWRATLLVWLTFTVYAVGYNSTDSDAYLLPAFAVTALWLAEGVAWLLERAAGRRWVAIAASGGLLVALVAGPVFVRYWQEQGVSPHLEADAFWRTALREAEPNAVILTSGDARTFALWYAVYGLRERPDVAVVNVNLWGFEWYRRTLADTHPYLLPSADEASVEELIRGWARERPVYATEDVKLQLQDLTGKRVGALTKLNP